MEVIHTYKTIDGKEFNNKTSALEHENNILQEQLNKLKSQTIISKTSLSDIKKELLAKIPEMPGVYMLVNPYDNYKKYIGSTNNLRSRYQSFLTSKVSYGGEKINQARKNTEPCKWQHIVLEICNVSDLTTKEAFYVDTFNSINNGYNGIIPSGSHEKSKDKIYKASESSWRILMERIKLNERKGEPPFNFSFTQEEYVNKRVEYIKKYPQQGLHNNFRLKTIGKDYTTHVFTIEDVTFVPSKISSLLTPRKKFQQNGLLSGVIYSKNYNKYTYIRAEKGVWYDSVDEAHIAYLENCLEIIHRYTNEYRGTIDEEVENILENLTVEQLKELILVE